MKYWVKVKSFLEEKEKYLFVFLLVPCLIEIINLDVIKRYAPTWVPTVITVVLISSVICYGGFMYSYLRQKYKDYFESINNDMKVKMNALEEHIVNLYDQNAERINKLQDELEATVKNSTDSILSDGENKVSLMMNYLDEKNEGILGRINEVETENKSQLDNLLAELKQQSNEILNKCDCLSREEKELLTEKVDLIIAEIKTTNEGLTEKGYNIIADVKASSDSLSALVDTKAEDIINCVNGGSDSITTTLRENVQSAESIIIERIQKMDEDSANAVDANTEGILAEVVAFKAIVEQVNESSKTDALEKHNAIIHKMDLMTDEIKAVDVVNLNSVIARIDEKAAMDNEIFAEAAKQNVEATKSIIQTCNDHNNKVIEANNVLSELIKIKALDGVSALENKAEEIVAVVNGSNKAIEESIQELETVSVAKGLENKDGILSNISALSALVIERANEEGEQLAEVRQVVNDNTDRIINKQVEDNATVDELAKQFRDDVDAKIVVLTEMLASMTGQVENRTNDQTDKIVRKFAEANVDRETHVHAIIEQLGGIQNQIASNDTEEQKKLTTLGEHIVEIQKASNVNVEKVLTGIVDTEASLKENQKIVTKSTEIEINKAINSIVEQISGVQSGITAITDKLVNGIAGLENTIVSEIVKVFDDVEKNAEKNNSNYNCIFNQISNFSKNTKGIVQKVKEELIQDNSRVSDDHQKEISTLSAQVIDIKKASKVNGDTVNSLGKQQELVLDRLEHLQVQISNLDFLAALLKNISTQQERASEKTSEKAPVATIKPDRVEEIKDNESGMTVHNTYKGNKLVLSEMYKGKNKVYEVTYGKGGEIVISKNYDNTGAVSTELSYYQNGQVKERKERVKVGGILKTVVSKFDQSGIKIK